MSKTTTLQEHLEFKKTSVSSKEKIKDISRYVGRFINSTDKPLDKFTETDLAKFINSTIEKHSVWATNDIKSFVKVFIKWHYEDYSSRFRNLDRLCKTKKPPKSHEPEQMLSPKEVDKLIDGEKDPIWKMYWALFYYGGFRPSECCRLEWSMISFDDKGTTIKIFSKKNNKTFYKSIPDKVSKDLKMLYDLHGSNNKYIFPSPVKDRVPIRAKTVYFRMKKLSMKVLGKSIFPYTLRHSLATTKYNDDNLKDDDVANQMGHNKSMKPTYTNLDVNKLKIRARKLWSEPVKLTEEKKHKLELRIEELEKGIEQIEPVMKMMHSFIKEIKAQKNVNYSEDFINELQAMRVK